MSTRSKNEILESFISITGCSRDRAVNFLRAVDWDEQDAVVLFFDSDNTEQFEPTASIETRSPVQNPNRRSRNEPNAYESDDDLLQNALEDSLRIKQSEKPSTMVPNRTNQHKSIISSKINTVDTWRRTDDDSDDEGQPYYAGGSERSGQQIIGPPKSKDNDKKVAHVFEAARRQGAREASDRETASSYSNKEKPFTGAGYSLNDEHVPSAARGPSSSDGAAAAAATANNNRVEQLPIRFYSNGFTVGDGELRQFEENREFMEYIKRGEVPPELRNLNSNGKQVEVSLEDHRGEEYKHVAPSFKPFTGTGHTVGLPRSGPGLSATIISDSLDTHHLEELARKRLRTSLSSSTIIRLRLPDISTSLCIPIDLNRTLVDIRKFLTENIPSLQSNTFEFMEPPSTRIKRDDEKKKIKDSKLSNCTLVVRRIA